MPPSDIQRPWLAHYGNLPHSVLDQRPPSSLAAFRAACVRAADQPAIRYFDATITYAELDRLSDAFAVWLERSGVAPSDRVMIVTNNIPHFVVALVGTWKLGAVPVPANPMYRGAELAKLLRDCMPRVIVCQHDQVATVRDGLARADLSVTIIAADPYDLQTSDDTRLLPPRVPQAADAPDFMTEMEAIFARGEASPSREVDPASLGLILYTSGTTGVPKGAMLTHQALAQSGCAARPWVNMRDYSVQLAIAPLFHITGLITCCCATFDGACCLVLTYRFDPSALLETIRAQRPNFLVAASTAFIALLANKEVDRDSMASLYSVYSGGAPVPAALVREFAERTGLTIQPAFGMTETAAGAIATPHGHATPIDPETGTLSIGIPMPDVDALIVDDEGHQVAPGVPGELLMRGPGLMQGYLNKPADTAETLRGGWMHSGDIAFMDAQGWFYIVDRKKDVINASGYKVWPREVEEVLYEHPAVFEAAVIGVPDPYRGETVKALISVKPGMTLNEDAVRAHCRERLAAYKQPKIIDIVAELPKSATGKISRAGLRAAEAAATDSEAAPSPFV